MLLLAAGMLNGQVLPDNGPAPEVDTITPVPAPEIPYAITGAEELKMPEELKIDNQGGTIEGNIETGLRLGGPVKVQGDNGLEIFANTAVLDLKEKSVTLSGDVSVYQGNLMQRGDQTVYYYERKVLDTSGLRASIDPILLEAGKFTAETRNGRQVYVGTDAGITTHDVEHPNFWVRSKKTTIYPGDKIVFNDLRLYAGETPVFWLPYLSQPLDGELGYHFIPGSSSSWGPFLLNTYGIMLGGKADPATGEKEDAWLLSRWHFDLRSRRGVGTGVDFFDTRVEDPDIITGLKLYYTHDLDPEISRSGLPRGNVDPDRYTAELKHRFEPDFPDDAQWQLDTNLTLLSDRYYLEDFETARFRTDPTPDNTIGLYRRDDDSLLSLYTRLRLNDFYRADTRLPEVAFDQSSRPVFGLPVLHEGSTTLGFIGEKAPDGLQSAIVDPLMTRSSGDPGVQRLISQLSGYERRLAETLVALPLNDPRRQAVRSQLLDSSYTRFRTYQQLNLPTTIGGFLTVTPQAGAGYSNYSAIDGPVGDFDRTILHLGTEASLKFSKDFGPYRNSDWGLDGLMHVFQPYTGWSWVSTDDFVPGQPDVDRLTPTTRPRPLDPARFTAVDEMNSWNVLRFGTRNHLLTKRDNQSFEWFYLDTYMDAFIEDPEGNRNFSNLYNDVRWQPVPWLGLDLETQFPITDNGSGFSEIYTRLRFMPVDWLGFSIGHRYLSGHPILQDSNHFNLYSYTRLSENWGFGMSQSVEMDDSTLEFQQYTVHRDLGNWVAGAGFSLRDNRLDQEYGVVFSLTLKDFPSVSLPFELDGQ